MKEHLLRLVRESTSTVQAEKAEHDSELNFGKIRQTLSPFPRDFSHVGSHPRPSGLHIPGMATNIIVQKVLVHNPDRVWLIAYRAVTTLTRPGARVLSRCFH